MSGEGFSNLEMFRFTWIGKDKQQWPSAFAVLQRARFHQWKHVVSSKKKNKYKGTWQHPRSRHWHMIDYVIVRWRDLQDLYHVRAMRDAECWTDHRLVRAKMELTIRPKAQHTIIPRPKKLEVSKFFLSSWNKEHLSECTYLYWTGWNKFMGGF